MYVYIYIFIYLFMIVRPDSSVVKSVCTVGTRSWVRIPLGPTFGGESEQTTPATPENHGTPLLRGSKSILYILHMYVRKSHKIW